MANTIKDMDPKGNHKMAKPDKKLSAAKAARKSQTTPGSNPKMRPTKSGK